MSRVLNLLALGFTVAFSAVLLLFVRWDALRAECILKDTCDISEVPPSSRHTATASSPVLQLYCPEVRLLLSSRSSHAWNGHCRRHVLRSSLLAVCRPPCQSAACQHRPSCQRAAALTDTVLSQLLDPHLHACVSTNSACTGKRRLAVRGAAPGHTWPSRDAHGQHTRVHPAAAAQA